MDKNLQNTDEVLNRAYQSYEDEPSAATWEKLSAALDKEDAEKYKRRFIGWKRIAVVLLFLLAGFMIYETGVVINRKKNAELAKKGNVSDSTSVTDKTDMQQKKTTAETKTTQQEKNKPASAFEISGQPQPSEVLIETNQKEVVAPNATQKNKSVNGQIETVEIVPKLNKASNKSAKIKTKITIMPGITVQAETGPLADNNLLENKVSGKKINDKHIKGNTNNENKSISKLVTSSATSITRVNITKPSTTDLAIKKPALPVINTTTNMAQLKNKKSSGSFKPFWSVTAFASNDWGQYKLDNDVQDNTGNQQDEKEEINHREKHEGSYSAGVFATRQFNKHIGLKTGLIYSNTTIGISPQEMYAAKKADGSVAYKYITSSGYGFVKPGFGLPPAVGDSIQSTEAQHNLQIISVPLMASYRFEKNKFSVSPAIGLSANFITSANVKTEVTDALNKEAVTINGLDGMKSFYTGLIADVNLQYNYNSKWSLSLLPGFRYALTPITKGNVVKTFPYSFNMGAGITYKF